MSLCDPLLCAVRGLVGGGRAPSFVTSASSHAIFGWLTKNSRGSALTPSIPSLLPTLFHRLSTSAFLPSVDTKCHLLLRFALSNPSHRSIGSISPIARFRPALRTYSTFSTISLRIVAIFGQSESQLGSHESPHFTTTTSSATHRSFAPTQRQTPSRRSRSTRRMLSLARRRRAP